MLHDVGQLLYGHFFIPNMVTAAKSAGAGIYITRGGKQQPEAGLPCRTCSLPRPALRCRTSVTVVHVARIAEATVGLADEILELLRNLDPALHLKYNKFYIGIEKDGKPFNFFTFQPKKKQINVAIKLPHCVEIDEKIDEVEFDTLGYGHRGGRYRLRLSKDDITTKSEVLSRLFRLAYDSRTNL